MPMTPEQHEAYRVTDYVVFSSPSVVLRIDQSNAELDALLVREGKQSAAFISAWNPYSERKAQEENDRAHRTLMDDLKQRGYALIEGEGKGRVGDWPAEKSVLAIGIDRVASEEVGRRFLQNAIVFHELGEPSKLLPLEEMIFSGSLMDGPHLDLVTFSGLELTDEESDRLQEATNMRDLLCECESVQENEMYEVDEIPGMSATLQARALQVASHEMDFVEAFSWLVQDELDRRHSRLLDRRHTLSGLPERKDLKSFDWGYNPRVVDVGVVYV